MDRKGRPLADTVIGTEWIRHIESYADVPFRITQGRHLFRTGGVKVSDISPYRCETAFTDSEKATVTMEALDENERKMLSSDLGRVLLNDGESDLTKIVFPPREKLHFDCTCRDSAAVCKHSLAALMALTENDSKGLITFFGLDMDFIENRVVQDSIDLMLSNADNHSERFLGPDKVKKLFGV